MSNPISVQPKRTHGARSPLFQLVDDVEVSVPRVIQSYPEAQFVVDHVVDERPVIPVGNQYLKSVVGFEPPR